MSVVDRTVWVDIQTVTSLNTCTILWNVNTQMTIVTNYIHTQINIV